MEELRSNFSEKALRDFQLVDAAINEKSDAAFAELMKLYKKPVYHMILKMIRNVDDAEDLTMEAFTKAFKNLTGFKKTFTFSTWLFRIATNNAIDFIRKKKLNTTSLSGVFSDSGEREGADLDIRDKDLTPDELVIKEQKKDLIQLLVKKLPPKYQRLVKLRYFEELSYEELAKEINAPLGTVKAQLHRTRELLYELVKDKKQHM